MKLYELKKGDHFVLADDPQKTPFEFDKIDGLYSRCYLNERVVVHLNANADVIKEVIMGGGDDNT